jgi:hypothetical protein
MLFTRRKVIKLFGASPLIFGRTVAVPDPDTLLEFYPGGVNTGATSLNAGFSNINGKTRRNGAILSSQRTAVLPIFGQSNTCNVNPTAYVPTNAAVCDNFSIYDGGTYAGGDPLLGCSTSTLGPGNPFLRLADSLVTAGIFDRVILAPAGIGATTMTQWGADAFNRVAVMGRRLAAANLTATAVLYQQGETASPNPSQAQYTADLALFIANVRLWHSGPVFVAESSWNGTAVQPNTTAAQIAAVTSTPNGIWSLGNMDQNTTTWRQSGAGEPHLNDVGAAGWAAAMYTALTAYGAPF